MGKVLFTSDLHFGHENVIRFDGRPFSTVEEMDNELIRRWNEKVAPGDLVYVLGDFIWKSRNDDAAELIRSLHGQIILIKGNHDRFLHNAKAKDALAGIKDYDDICVTWKTEHKNDASSVIILFPCTTVTDTSLSTFTVIPTIPKKHNWNWILLRKWKPKGYPMRYSTSAVCTGTTNR